MLPDTEETVGGGSRCKGGQADDVTTSGVGANGGDERKI